MSMEAAWGLHHQSCQEEHDDVCVPCEVTVVVEEKAVGGIRQ
jgi:hypothetical protein